MDRGFKLLISESSPVQKPSGCISHWWCRDKLVLKRMVQLYPKVTYQLELCHTLLCTVWVKSPSFYSI